MPSPKDQPDGKPVHYVHRLSHDSIAVLRTDRAAFILPAFDAGALPLRRAPVLFFNICVFGQPALQRHSGDHPVYDRLRIRPPLEICSASPEVGHGVFQKVR